MKDKHYLIVDEMSMMGQRMFAWVDRRLRQATAKLDEPLGGISVILFGDFAQLPPVCDLPLYSNPNKNPLSIHGYTIYRTFSKIIILDKVLRQAGTHSSACQFRDVLLRVRDGVILYDDWQTLLQRSLPHVDNFQDFHEAVHLFYDRQSVAKFSYDNRGRSRPLQKGGAKYNYRARNFETTPPFGETTPIKLPRSRPTSSRREQSTRNRLIQPQTGFFSLIFV